MTWLHLHLALNHVPVLGTPFLTLLLAVGLWRRSQEIIRVSVWGFVLLCAISIPIKFTGDFAADSLAGKREAEQQLITDHETAADRATTGIFLLGVASVAGLVAGRRKPSLPNWSILLVLILALGTSAMMAYTANLGGQIRHPEIRRASP